MIDRDELAWYYAELEASAPFEDWFYARAVAYAHAAARSRRGKAILIQIRRVADNAETPA